MCVQVSAGSDGNSWRLTFRVPTFESKDSNIDTDETDEIFT